MGDRRARRALLVTSSFTPDLGGLARLVDSVATSLRESGWDVTVATQASRAPGLVGEEQRADGVVVHRFWNRVGGRRFALAPGLAAGVRRLAREADVVHVFSFHAPAAMVASWVTDRPLVFTPVYHGGGHTSLARAVHVAYRPFATRLFARSRVVIALSRAEAELIEATQPSARGRVRIIHAAVDAAPHTDVEPMEVDQPVVLVAGRLDAYKQVDRVVEAVAQIDHARLVIVGDGPELERLRSRAVTFPAAKRPVVLGRVDDDTLRRWQATARVAVSLSRHESFGLSLAEAAAAGAEIVASDIPAHRELADIVDCHIHFVDADVTTGQLAAAIEDALAEVPRARGLVRSRSWLEVAQETTSAYEAAQRPFGHGDEDRRRVSVVGSSTEFLSGISYYTIHLVEALAADRDVSAVLMRRLIPRMLYPGRTRVGERFTERSTAHHATTFDGIDWTMLTTLPRAIQFLDAHQPDAIVFEWWTAATLPTYWAITRWAKCRGVAVVVELHEGLHDAEATIPVIGWLARRALRRWLRHADAYVVHSEFDRTRLSREFAIPESAMTVIAHGPYALTSRDAVPPRDEVTILFFGTIRPYKGLEILVDAFDQLDRGETAWRLLIVGEPWEGWTAPFERLNVVTHRNEVELVARYVRDDEVATYFARADLVALPYLASSASGPLHMAMAAGLPVVVSDVGGLTEAVAGYEGAVLVTPGDTKSLRDGLERARELVGRRFDDPRSWDNTARQFDALLTALDSRSTSGGVA